MIRRLKSKVKVRIVNVMGWLDDIKIENLASIIKMESQIDREIRVDDTIVVVIKGLGE